MNGFFATLLVAIPRQPYVTMHRAYEPSNYFGPPRTQTRLNARYRFERENFYVWYRELVT